MQFPWHLQNNAIVCPCVQILKASLEGGRPAYLPYICRSVKQNWFYHLSSQWLHSACMWQTTLSVNCLSSRYSFYSPLSSDVLVVDCIIVNMSCYKHDCSFKKKAIWVCEASSKYYFFLHSKATDLATKFKWKNKACEYVQKLSSIVLWQYQRL